MSTHNVDINVNANTKGAEKSLGYLQSLMSEFGKLGTSKIAGLLGAAAVAKMAFDKVSEAISKNIATAKQVSNLAIKFNIDPKAMHSMKMAADDAGVSVRALTMAMKQMGKYAEKGLGSKEIQINFKQLGIEAEKLAEIQAKPAKFLPEIAKSLMEIGDENQRAAAGALLLGRQYQMLLPLIEDLGTSEEARQKFLDNENAMTDEQIAANKEISKIQNDLNDNFEKMVASAAPLLNWAMNFVNFLAQGLGFLKDMIFETDKAREERETKAVGNVANRVARYQENLKVKQGAGTLTEEERAGIEAAGGTVEGYISSQTTLLDRRSKAEDVLKKEESDYEMYGWYDQKKKRRVYSDAARDAKAQKAIAEAKAVMEETQRGLSGSFREGLGIAESQRGESGVFKTEQRKAFEASVKDIKTASGTGDLGKIAKVGITEANKQIRGKADAAREANLKEKQAKYIEARKTGASLIGEVYDIATDKSYGKTEYRELLRERGESEKQISAKISTFEDEGLRKKREKQERQSSRALKASERKLYVGDASEGKMVSGELEDVAKAEDALLDIQDARLEAQEDLNEQVEAMLVLETKLAKLKEDEEGNAANIANLESQLNSETLKRNELQVKVNQAVLQEVHAREAVRKANEKAYWEEKKHQEDLKAMKDANADHEKNLKYKLMQAEGATREQIAQAKLVDESKRYEQMLIDYKKEYNELMSNKETGKKTISFITGEEEADPLSDTERSKLEEMSKRLDAQKRTIMDSAFELGKGDQGRVTDMRRIGGGGMEYGGLANTARSQLEEARKHTALLQQSLQVLRGDNDTIYREDMRPQMFPMPTALPSLQQMVSSDALAMPAIPKVSRPPANRGPRVNEFGQYLW